MSITMPSRDTPLRLTSNGYQLVESPGRLGRLRPVPREERQDFDALRARLSAQGYLYLPGFFDRRTIQTFRTFYFATLEVAGLTRPGTAPGLGVAAEVENLDRGLLRTLLFREVVPSAAFERICHHPTLVAFYSGLLGTTDVHLHKRKIIRHVGPGERGIGTATQAHYDLVYLREGTDRVYSSWIPLGDIPVSRGPLIYLENSHHRVLDDERSGRLRRPAASITADLPALADDHDTRWLVSDFEAGDMMVHDPHIIHASLDNDDPEGILRLSTDIRYQAASDDVDGRWQRHWDDQDGL